MQLGLLARKTVVPEPGPLWFSLTNKAVCASQEMFVQLKTLPT